MLEKPEWMVRIGVTSDNHTDVLEFGQAATASSGLDPEFDLLAPPPLPFERTVAVLSAGSEHEVPKLLRDIKNTGLAQWHVQLNADKGALVTWNLSDVRSAIVRRTFSAVPTGTVLLVITNLGPIMCSPMVCATASTC